MQTHAALDAFAAPTRAWFTERLGEPAPAQALAWEAISSGKHALVVAPTGSGKTLAAFLWAVDRLLASPAPAFSKAQLESQIDATNEQLKQSNEQLSFKLHEGTHQMVVRLVDAKTEQVLKEFPSEHFLDVVADLMKVAGLQVDETR